MAEGGVNEDVAVLAEGGTVNQTIERGTINVVAGDQIHGSQENIHNGHGMDANRQGNATAMLAEGEHVNQRFTKCDVNVVAADQIHGNVAYNTYHIHRGTNYADEGRRLVNAGVEPDACSSGGNRDLEPPPLRTNQNDGITPIQKRRKIIGDPKYKSPLVKLKEKMTVACQSKVLYGEIQRYFWHTYSLRARHAPTRSLIFGSAGQGLATSWV